MMHTITNEINASSAGKDRPRASGVRHETAIHNFLKSVRTNDIDPITSPTELIVLALGYECLKAAYLGVSVEHLSPTLRSVLWDFMNENLLHGEGK